MFTDALDKYQQLLKKDRILIVRQVSFDTWRCKMTAREVMDIDEAGKNNAGRYLADGQMMTSFKPTPSILNLTALGQFQYISTIRGRMHARGCVWRDVACPLERSFIKRSRGLIGSSRWNWSLTNAEYYESEFPILNSRLQSWKRKSIL